MEDGAMRGMFTCGVIDVLLENNIDFDVISNQNKSVAGLGTIKSIVMTNATQALVPLLKPVTFTM